MSRTKNSRYLRYHISAEIKTEEKEECNFKQIYQFVFQHSTNHPRSAADKNPKDERLANFLNFPKIHEFHEPSPAEEKKTTDDFISLQKKTHFMTINVFSKKNFFISKLKSDIKIL